MLSWRTRQIEREPFRTPRTENDTDGVHPPSLGSFSTTIRGLATARSMRNSMANSFLPGFLCRRSSAVRCFCADVLPARDRDVSGPVIGSSFDPGDPTPRAVHKDYFKQVCPNPTILDSDAVVSGYLRYDNDVPASQVFDMWVNKLNSINDPCVEIQLGSPQLFEIWCVFRYADVASRRPRRNV